jgi:ubiquinone/menaquinone biosynthesis C-methylase UbiE
MKGIVADLPSVVEGAKRVIQDRGIEDRCEAVACDFFKEIPAGSDAYLMSHILHDWLDKPCKIILRNCHRAMKPNSKLLVVEMVIPPGNEPSVAKLLDLEMLVITGGCERTETEFKELLESSGFILSRIIPTKERICIIEVIRS